MFAETWIYEPTADRWTAGPPMRTPRHGLAAAAIDGTVYAIAGGEVVSGGRAGGTAESSRSSTRPRRSAWAESRMISLRCWWPTVRVMGPIVV